MSTSTFCIKGHGFIGGSIGGYKELLSWEAVHSLPPGSWYFINQGWHYVRSRNEMAIRIPTKDVPAQLKLIMLVLL